MISKNNSCSFRLLLPPNQKQAEETVLLEKEVDPSDQGENGACYILGQGGLYLKPIHWIYLYLYLYLYTGVALVLL